MLIGAVADPLEWDRWPEAAALLEPARIRGNFDQPIEADEALYVVLDGDELLAAATAWLSTDGYVEVKLLGGRDHRRWLKELDQTIGADAARAGATRMIGIGRRGWLRQLKRLGWGNFQPIGNLWLVSRELKIG